MTGSHVELLLKCKPSFGGVSPKWDFNFILRLKLLMLSMNSFLLTFFGVGMKLRFKPSTLYSVLVKPSPDRFTTCPKGSVVVLVELITCSRSLL